MAEDVSKVISQILKEAETKKTNARYNGEYGDGGAGTLEMQVKFYRYGLQGVMPKEWESYAKKTDPEYDEYLRLKEKFKGV